jgi:protease IV
MEERQENGRSPLRMILLFILVIIVPLAAGLYLAPRLVPRPQIGIARLDYDIASDTAFVVAEQLAYARNNAAIKAVVLIINSPGGSAAYSEELFLDVLHTRRQMPVIASVDLLAASGAYYLAAAADEIYAKPTSGIGSIGVIAFLPGELFVEEDLLTTGPYKSFGGSRDTVTRQIERAKFAFLEAIETGRAERLQVDLATLSRAEIYTGVQAWEFGLIDGLAANDEVVRRAAQLAGLRGGYDVVQLYPLAFPGAAGVAGRAYEPAPLDAARLWAPPTDLPPGLYYRHVELTAVQP